MDTTWNEFYKTMTWGELVREYDEGLQRVNRYVTTHPEQIPLVIREACSRLTVLQEQLKRVANTSAMHDQLAPPEAVRVILRVVGRVRQEVPFAEQSGQA